MSLEFDREETTPDGRLRIRRVPVRADVMQLTARVFVFGTRLFDWYLATVEDDRWLRYGQTTVALPDNRFAVVESPRAYERLSAALAAMGQPWAELVPPEQTVAQDAADAGVPMAAIVNSKLLDVVYPEDVVEPPDDARS